MVANINKMFSNNAMKEQMCKICSSKANHMSLITDRGLADILVHCMNVQIPDQLGTVCGECASEIVKWCSFRNKVLKAFGAPQYSIPKSTYGLLPNATNIEVAKITNIYSQKYRTNSVTTEYLSNAGFQFDNESKIQVLKENNSKNNYEKQSIHNKKIRFCSEQGRENHHNNKYNCNECSKKFHKKVQSHHTQTKINDKQTKCEFCRIVFSNKQLLKIHLETKCKQLKLSSKRNLHKVVNVRTKYLVAAGIQFAKEMDEQDKLFSKEPSIEKSDLTSIIYSDASSSYQHTSLDGINISGLTSELSFSATS